MANRGGTIATIAIALFAGTGRVAAAEVTDEDLIKQGVESRRRQDDAGALELFKRAYSIRKSARAAGQIGFAELALGRWVDAETHLEEALVAADDPWVRKNGAALRTSMERVRRHLGDLDVLGSPAGAEIIIEGQVRGTLPLAKPMRVRTGACRFDMRAPGYTLASRTVEIEAGALTRETINLSRVIEVARDPVPADAAAAKVVVTAPVAAAVAPDRKPPSVDVRRPGETAPVEKRAGSSRLRMAGVVLGATGAAAVAAGLAFGLGARAAGDNNSRAAKFDPDADNRGHTYQTLQWVGYGVGAALITGGVATLLLGAQRTSSDAPKTIAIIPASGGGALALVSRRL